MSKLKLNGNDIVCAGCGHTTDDSALQCRHCSNSWSTDEVQLAIAERKLKQGSNPTRSASDANVSVNQNYGFFENLMQGNYGLLRTYWLYGFAWGLVVTILGVVLTVVTGSKAVAVVFVLIAIFYQIAVSVGVWSAARKYSGSRLWRTLARASVIIAGINSLFQFSLLFISLLVQ